MEIFKQTPVEIIYLILQYTGELRILKRKMTNKNMFQIINDDIRNNDSIIQFVSDIVDRPICSGPTTGYFYYWNLLEEIIDNKVCRTKKFISENLLHQLINVFINDYNNYYLDDKYYIDSIWINAICYADYSSNILQKTKNEIESYRHKVFHEIEQYRQKKLY